MENELSILISWLISFIGIGVTALLGINIWTSLSIDKRIEVIVKKEVESLKEQNVELRDQLKNYSLAISERSVGDEYMRMGITGDAIFNYLNSLEYSIVAQDKSLISENLDSCLSIIKESPAIAHCETTMENLENIKEILMQIHDERSYELYSYFVSSSKNENDLSLQESLSKEKNEQGNIR